MAILRCWVRCLWQVRVAGGADLAEPAAGDPRADAVQPAADTVQRGGPHALSHSDHQQPAGDARHKVSLLGV